MTLDDACDAEIATMLGGESLRLIVLAEPRTVTSAG